MLMPVSEKPHNPQAEQAVLGCCILSPEALSKSAGILKPEDFYVERHKIIWRAVTGMFTADKAVDLVSLADELNRQGVFERIGGQTALVECMNAVTTTANVSYHAGIVKDYALRRRMLEASESIAKLAVNYDKSGGSLLDEAEQILSAVSGGRRADQPESMKDLTPSAFQAIEQAYRGEVKEFTGYSSGFKDVNKLLSGFQPGSLNIIAARPSMGKTALALNIAQFGGNQGENPCVLIFSLEMPSRQLVQRMFAAQSRVNVASLGRGSITEAEYMRLKEAAGVLSSRNIYITDRSDLSITDFRAVCRRFKMSHPELALIVVDYIQLMRSSVRYSENRQNEVAEISRGMKSVALELNCPVIALSQLSREAERRSDKKPQLSDLRDSGAIEQDADTVMMLFRESYYSEYENNDLVDDTAELRVAKNRNGATGICKLIFQREYTRFANLMEARQ